MLRPWRRNVVSMGEDVDSKAAGEDCVSNFSSMRDLVRRFISFSGVGAIGTAAHYAVLVVLAELGAASPALAAGAGALAGATVNYLLNYRLTFRSRASHLLTAPRFAVIALLGMAASALLVQMAVAVGLHYIFGQILATVLVLAGGFAANQFWTFAETRNDRRR